MSISGIGTKEDGTPVIIIGVEEANLNELRNGHPLVVPKERAGGTEVMIFYGETMADLIRLSKRIIGPDTKIGRY